VFGIGPLSGAVDVGGSSLQLALPHMILNDPCVSGAERHGSANLRLNRHNKKIRTMKPRVMRHMYCDAIAGVQLFRIYAEVRRHGAKLE
jgi:hypothetical protein